MSVFKCNQKKHSELLGSQLATIISVQVGHQAWGNMFEHAWSAAGSSQGFLRRQGEYGGFNIAGLNTVYDADI